MKEDLFIEKHRDEWSALEAASLRIEKSGLRKFGASNARTFLQNFRNTSHHLAYARTHYPDSDLTNYLNSLIGKCQTHIYAVQKLAPREILNYLTTGYPKALRGHRFFVLAAFLVFMAGASLGFGMTALSVDNAAFFLPDGMIESIKGGKSGSGEWNYPLMSSVIMTNNIGISLKAFALGITFGLGTLYILFFNGALLGALTSVVYQFGDPLSYWSLILPHGVLELAAIFIAGASGLILARGILLPGELTRGHSLIRGALQAITLVFGSAVMLVLAGVIEGFFTPLPLDPWIKLGFAGATAVLLGFYVLKPSSGS